MTNIRAHGLLVVAASLFASVAGAASKPVDLELRLPKKPPVARPEMPAPIAEGPLSLVITDARVAEEPAVVGGQRIKGEDIYFWRAVQPVAGAVADQVAQLLKGWSVVVAPEADLTLRLALMRYYVDERSDTFGSTYIAEVRFMMSLTDRAGATLWTGEANGDAKRSGVDARASMCNQALSFALSRALAQGLSSVKLEMAAPVPVAPESSVEPAALLSDLTRLLAGGVTQDVLVAYIEQRRLTRPLTVDEILQWKNAGIPDAAIKAATQGQPR